MPVNEGERAWAAWQRYQTLQDPPKNKDEGTAEELRALPFSHATEQVRRFFAETAYLSGQIEVTTEALEECYWTAFAEKAPSVVEDAQYYLQIMGKLVGKTCSLRMTTPNPYRGWMNTGQVSYTVTEPLQVTASGLEPNFRDPRALQFIAPMIEVEIKSDFEDSGLPTNWSQQDENRYTYPWMRIRSITVM